MNKNHITKGEASRKRLLAAAAQQFAQVGYHSTKISDIVKNAELTQAAFYLYFPSKASIFEEIVSEFQSRLKLLANSGTLVTSLPQSDVPNQAKENIVNLMTFLAASPQLSKVALIESKERETIKKEIVAMISLNLRSNQEAGHIRNNLPIQIAAECMVAMVERMVVKLIEENHDAVELANDMADVMLYGILAQPMGK
jgi:AcrR family transcriptional regulator